MQHNALALNSLQEKLARVGVPSEQDRQKVARKPPSGPVSGGDGKWAKLSPGVGPSRLTPGLARADSLNDSKQSQGVALARAGLSGGPVT